MPALNFTARFREPIASGLKTHTIRPKAPPGFRLGHWAPLYVGLRTRGAALIGSGLMSRLAGIRLDFDAGTVELPVGGYPLTHADDLDDFARRDGFADWDDMAAFWAATHPGQRQFSGVLLGWSRLVFSHRIGPAAAQEPA